MLEIPEQLRVYGEATEHAASRTVPLAEMPKHRWTGRLAVGAIAACLPLLAIALLSWANDSDVNVSAERSTAQEAGGGTELAQGVLLRDGEDWRVISDKYLTDSNRADPLRELQLVMNEPTSTARLTLTRGGPFLPSVETGLDASLTARTFANGDIIVAGDSDGTVYLGWGPTEDIIAFLASDDLSVDVLSDLYNRLGVTNDAVVEGDSPQPALLEGEVAGLPWRLEADPAGTAEQCITLVAYRDRGSTCAVPDSTNVGYLTQAAWHFVYGFSPEALTTARATWADGSTTEGFVQPQLDGAAGSYFVVPAFGEEGSPLYIELANAAGVGTRIQTTRAGG